MSSQPEVLRVQRDVLTTRQALRLWSRATIRANLAAHRWQRPTRGVLVTHNGPLAAEQRLRVALLTGPPGSALAGMTALQQDGLEGFPVPPRPQVVLPDGAERPTYQDLAPRWSTMLDERDVHPTRSPRRTRAQRSLVDEASWSANPRRARLVILTGVQQRLARPSDLRDALSRRGLCRHRALIVQSVLDAVGGIQSLPERDSTI
jgi:hypothetical protein